MVAKTILFYLWMSSLLKFGPKAAGQGQACNLIVPMRRSDLEEQIRIWERLQTRFGGAAGWWTKFQNVSQCNFLDDLS